MKAHRPRFLVTSEQDAVRSDRAEWHSTFRQHSLVRRRRSTHAFVKSGLRHQPCVPLLNCPSADQSRISPTPPRRLHQLRPRRRCSSCRRRGDNVAAPASLADWRHIGAYWFRARSVLNKPVPRGGAVSPRLADNPAWSSQQPRVRTGPPRRRDKSDVTTMMTITMTN